MQKILVGADGSPASQAAVSRAAELARALGQKLVLVYVIELPRVPPSGAPLGARPDLIGRSESFARELLASEARRVASPGLEVSAEVRLGSPAHELAAMAEAPDVECVAVGRHALSPLVGALLGSVALRLVQLSPKPVLILPGERQRNQSVSAGT